MINFYILFWDDLMHIFLLRTVSHKIMSFIKSVKEPSILYFAINNLNKTFQ
jgi:hypothetical protein